MPPAPAEPERGNIVFQATKAGHESRAEGPQGAGPDAERIGRGMREVVGRDPRFNWAPRGGAGTAVSSV